MGEPEPAAEIVRSAEEGDLGRIAEIYNHAVATGTATLDWDPRSVASMADWWALHRHAGRHRAVVLEDGSHVLGWASLSPFAARRGYRASAELSVYLAPEAIGRGRGGVLCAALTEHARRAGLASVLGLCTDTNLASITMLERHGYTRCGAWSSVGYKQGRLVGLVLFEIVFAENCARYTSGEMDDVFR